MEREGETHKKTEERGKEVHGAKEKWGKSPGVEEILRRSGQPVSPRKKEMDTFVQRERGKEKIEHKGEKIRPRRGNRRLGMKAEKNRLTSSNKRIRKL